MGWGDLELVDGPTGQVFPPLLTDNFQQHPTHLISTRFHFSLQNGIFSA